MQRKIRRKVKNFILKGITTIASALVVLSAGCADSPSNIPFIVCVVSLSWLALFAYANSDRRKKVDYEKSV